MRVVLDTNILVSAVLWHDSVSRKLVSKLLENNARIFTSEEILEEFYRILKRDFEPSNQELAHYTQQVLNFTQHANPTQKLSIVTQDPDDNKILECALAANAHYIVTYDKQILALERYQGTRIITPEQALRML